MGISSSSERKRAIKKEDRLTSALHQIEKCRDIVNRRVPSKSRRDLVLTALDLATERFSDLETLRTLDMSEQTHMAFYQRRVFLHDWLARANDCKKRFEVEWEVCMANSHDDAHLKALLSFVPYVLYDASFYVSSAELDRSLTWGDLYKRLNQHVNWNGLDVILNCDDVADLKKLLTKSRLELQKLYWMGKNVGSSQEDYDANIAFLKFVYQARVDVMRVYDESRGGYCSHPDARPIYSDSLRYVTAPADVRYPAVAQPASTREASALLEEKKD